MYNCKRSFTYNVVYKITNIKNNKEYIGVHSTNDLNDNYYGSGRAIKRAIKKYGIKSFIKEVLHCFDTRAEALEKEKELVDECYVKNKNTYNLSIGGTSYIDSLKVIDSAGFLEHQSKAGLLGARAFYNSLTKDQKREWHRKGRAATTGNLGKKLKIKNTQQYKAARVGGAFKRQRKKCPHCNSDKKFDPGNLSRHLKKCKSSQEEMTHLALAITSDM